MSEPLLSVRELKTWFNRGSRWPFNARQSSVKAVDGVSFDIHPGEVLSLVGESGCGKSTVGRTLTRLENATAGSAWYQGKDILALRPSAFRVLRSQIQMIFQDPFASLNPRMTIEQILSEPLRLHKLAHSKTSAKNMIAEILQNVGLDAGVMSRYPHEFSGGQRQRIAIARVMILQPSLVIADEPVSALDVSIQAQVLNLLKEIQRTTGVAMLFISHDLGVVRHLSHRIAVMYLGRIVETGTRADIFDNPSHPYTQLLLSSIPRADPRYHHHRLPQTGEPGSATSPPSGCHFHPRCPHASDRCKTESPQLTNVGNIQLSTKHLSACHHIDKLVAERLT